MNRLFESKKVKTIIPYLFCITILLLKYVNNYRIEASSFELLFSETIVLSLLLCIKQLVISIIINITVKDDNKRFILKLLFIMTFTNSIESYILYLIIYLLSFLYKNKKTIVLDSISSILILSTLIIFSIQVIKISYYMIYEQMRVDNYTIKNNNINVTNKNNKPNIYWIHADGMTSIETTKKYFDYEDEYLSKYLEENNYIVNKDVKLITGHHTMLSLVALECPNYYDKIFKKYLENLEEYYLTGKVPNKYIRFNTLTEERVKNNELINSLKLNGYTTIEIGQYNQYSALGVDYLYEVYGNDYYDKKYRFVDLRKKDYNERYRKIRETKLGYSIRETFNIPYESLLWGSNKNYKVDLKDYKFLNNTYYSTGKIIAKGIVDGNSLDNKNKFFFIDFDPVHLYWLYDENGKKIDLHKVRDLNSYKANYIYSTYLLVDIIELIKNTDPNALIIIQGDHGIHALSSITMNKYFGIDIEEIEDIRNSVISAIYIPEEYKNGEEEYLSNPLNITRYLVNNYVGNNYKYIEE